MAKGTQIIHHYHHDMVDAICLKCDSVIGTPQTALLLKQYETGHICKNQSDIPSQGNSGTAASARS